MKKIKCLLLALILLMVPVVAFAQGGVSVSTTAITVEKGKTATFKVTANNAAGRIDLSSSNTGVATINVGSKFLDKDSVTVTVTGKAVGTSVITVNLTDVSTYDLEEKTGAYKITVTVKEPAKKVTPATNNKANNNNNNNNNNIVVEEPKEETPKEDVKTAEELNYEKALSLVVKAETSKKVDDVNTAKDAVGKLTDASKKYDLMDRLLNISIEISKESNNKNLATDMREISADVTGGKSWFFLSVILMICLVAETAYLLVKEVKKNEA